MQPIARKDTSDLANKPNYNHPKYSHFTGGYGYHMPFGKKYKRLVNFGDYQHHAETFKNTDEFLKRLAENIKILTKRFEKVKDIKFPKYDDIYFGD